MSFSSPTGQVLHREYRFYNEHMQNIVKNPFHEAYFMGIDNRWISREELITKCLGKLVLAHTNYKHYHEHLQNIANNPFHEAWVLGIDNRQPREELIWKCFQKIVLITQSNEQSSQDFMKDTNISCDDTSLKSQAEPGTMSPGKDIRLQ